MHDTVLKLSYSRNCKHTWSLNYRTSVWKCRCTADYW